MSGRIGSNRAMFSQCGMLEMTYIRTKNEPNRVMSGHKNEPILYHIGSISGRIGNYPVISCDVGFFYFLNDLYRVMSGHVGFFKFLLGLKSGLIGSYRV